MNFFFVVFCLFVLLPNLMSKLIHNRCICELVIKTTGIWLQCKQTIVSCFHVLVRYSLLFSSEIILKQLFASVNIVNYNPTINFRAILLATLGHVVQNHRTVIMQ